MHRIIKGKKYDTKKSRQICIHCCYVNKWDRWEAVLYRQDRDYFLAGNGGASSIFAQKEDGGSYKDGEKIIPIDQKMAIRFIFKGVI